MLLYEIRKNLLVIRLSGELDHRQASHIRSEIDALIHDSMPKRLVFDLTGLDFMDSSGIGLILGRYKRMKSRGGSVAVSGVSRRMNQIFEMAGLYQVVEKLA